MISPWQVYFYIVPDTVCDDFMPLSLKWKRDIFYSVETYFGDKLWKTEGISKNIVQYGTIWENCIEICETEDGFSLMFSIDLRAVTEELIDRICEFCKFRDALALTPENAIVKPEFKNILGLLVNSEAARFCMYAEPHFARRRDEFDYNRNYWWEKYVPEKNKLHSIDEINAYVLNIIKNLKNGSI